MAGSFFQELKRRNVFRVALVYIVVCWLLMQIGDVMFPALRLPEWTPTLLAAFLILGFPLVVVFAWAFELTADGVARTSDVPESESITANTGRKINYTIIAVLALAVVFLLFKDSVFDDEPAAPAVIVTDHSIAVLPFKNQSASAENAEFFAGGLHDELLTLLSKLGDLKVISRTSVERLDPDLGIPEIGELLGVATVLEGQVQRAGNRLRINVQLIDTVAEGHLWANTYDSELTAENVFDVQSDIARTIANALQAELSPDDVETLAAVPTTNTEAYEKYLLAMQVAKRRTYSALFQAETYLVEVTEMDPSFADAWVSLALVRGELFATGAITAQRYVEEGGNAIEVALELDPRNAPALTERGRIQTAAGDWEGAQDSFEKAFAIAPRNSSVRDNYGEWLRSAGRLEEARDMLAGGLEYDPLSPNLLFQLGRTEMYLGNPERNIELGERLLEIDPSIVYGYTALLQANVWRGRYDEAWPWYIKTLEADSADHEIWAHISVFLNDLGEQDLADRYMAHAESLNNASPVVVKCKAIILTNRGQLEEAAELADRMLVDGFDDRWGSDHILLRTLRDEALNKGEYQDILGRYRERVPLLFTDPPEIHPGNSNKAADLALLLQANEQHEQAARLIDAALGWIDANQLAGVYGYIHGIASAELHAVAGNEERALAILRDAVNKGYRWQWPWLTGGRNFDALRDRPEFVEILAENAAESARQLETLLATPHKGDFDLRDRQ